MKTKAQPSEQLPNGANDLAVEFYLSDAASTPPNDPRVRFHFTPLAGPLPLVTFDHALSEYSTVTPAQKLALRNTLLALRDETFTLEGYT